jgi:hypothetical protein
VSPKLPGLLLLGGWITITVVLSALLQGFAAVGGLPMLAIFFAVNNPRGVLLTDRGVALLKCGFLNGRPTDLVSVEVPEALTHTTEQQAGATRVHIGGHHIWVRDKDLAMLNAARTSRAA